MTSSKGDITHRCPDQVMHLHRIGSFHQSRLSFMRSLLRKLKHERWHFERPIWRINQQGIGVAVYTATGPHQSYSLVAFAHDIPDHMRSDRVIATMWDATFCLYDGIPDEQDIKRLAANVPYQEAGRVSASELSLSRANRSVRLWDYVIDCLAQGKQPESDRILEVGYLMRTTAVYGSGKFGALDRQFLIDRPFAQSPFAIEMLSVYLTRCFVIDLVEHIASCKGGNKASVLDPSIRRTLGIGNSTGLGMAPFCIHHLALLHHWIHSRETALYRIRRIAKPTASEIEVLKKFVRRARLNAHQWHSDHALQTTKINALRKDMDLLEQHVQTMDCDGSWIWHDLVCWSESHLSVEGQEQLVSLLFEPYPMLVDPLCEEMHVHEDNYFAIDGSVTVATLRNQLNTQYQWCQQYDFNDPINNDKFWYVSEEKLEPRIGQRYQEPGAERELPFHIARDVQLLNTELSTREDNQLVADLLLDKPEFRYLVRRVQCTNALPYAEIRDNLTASDTLPLDILRCKLSFFGATKFDPRSDKWLRICMYQNAPFPDELSTSEDDWCYPQEAGL